MSVVTSQVAARTAMISPYVCMAIVWTIPCEQLTANMTNVTNSKFEVSDCLFTNLSASTNGGSISINSTGTLLYISQCLFEDSSCSTTYNGGAVYFEGGNCSATRSCGFRCQAKDGQFLNMVTVSTSISTSQISMMMCSSESLNGGYSASRFVSQKQTHQSLNNSQCYCNMYGCALQITYATDGLLEFANFFNSTAYNHDTWIYQTSNTLLAYNNFISLTGMRIMSSTDSGIFNASYCILCNNSGSYLFYSTNLITVTHCWIASNTATLTYGAVTIGSCITSVQSTYIQYLSRLPALSDCYIASGIITSSNPFTEALVYKDRSIIWNAIGILLFK